jgi:hypothetical protein
MKLLKIGLFLLALGLWGCADDVDDFVPDNKIDPGGTELVGDIRNFFDEIDPEELTESFTGFTDWEIRIVTKNETLINIPPYSFVEPSFGQLVTGPVNVDIVELRTPGEILLMGVQTESYGNLLESGGEFNLTVTQNGTKLDLLPGKRIRFRVKDDDPKEHMELWYTAETELNPSTGEIVSTWDDADDDPNLWDNVLVTEWAVQLNDSTLGGSGLLEGRGYDCWSDSLNWINIDVFMDLSEDDKTDVCVSLPEGFGNTNSVVFLIFEDFNGIIDLPGNPDDMLFCNYYTNFMKVGVPIGAAVKFVVISELGKDNYYFGLVETNIEADHLENIVPVKMTFKEIKDIIMGL